MWLSPTSQDVNKAVLSELHVYLDIQNRHFPTAVTVCWLDMIMTNNPLVVYQRVLQHIHIIYLLQKVFCSNMQAWKHQNTVFRAHTKSYSVIWGCTTGKTVFFRKENRYPRCVDTEPPGKVWLPSGKGHCRWPCSHVRTPLANTASRSHCFKPFSRLVFNKLSRWLKIVQELKGKQSSDLLVLPSPPWFYQKLASSI